MNAPIAVDIQDVLWTVTSRCNLNCIYCSVNAGKNIHPTKDLELWQIDRIIEQFRKMASLQSIILSGGEFLLTTHYQYILESLSLMNKNLFVITNGTYLKRETIEVLLRYMPTIMISADSSQENINAKTRGKKKLELTVRNISKYLEAGLDIVLIMVVTKYNINTIPEDLIYWRQLGVKNVLLQQLHAEGRGNQVYSMLSPHPNDIKKLYESLTIFEKMHKDVNLDYNEICLFPMRPSYFIRKCKDGIKYLPQKIFMCEAGYKFFAIKDNGDLIPCNAMQDYVFGNILCEDIKSILDNSPQLLEIQKWRTHRVDECGNCANCTYNPICDGGCRADVLNLGYGLLSKHPLCDTFSNNYIKA